MKHSDFRIGLEFTMSDVRWRCTDVGTRTVIAIKLDRPDDPSWYRGPPYALEEVVLDSGDLLACDPADGPSTAQDDAEEQRRRHANVVRFFERELRRFGVEHVDLGPESVKLTCRASGQGQAACTEAPALHEALEGVERQWRQTR